MNQIIKNSPADKAGLKIGEKYKVAQMNSSFATGTIVTFVLDDGSSMPKFEGKSKDGDSWNYLSVSALKAVSTTAPVKAAPKVAPTKTTVKAAPKVPKLEYSLCITANKTTLTFEKHLSTEQIAAILKLVDKE